MPNFKGLKGFPNVGKMGAYSFHFSHNKHTFAAEIKQQKLYVNRNEVN